MKKSELKSYIKENIINTLEQEENKISPEDVKSQQSYNAELKKTVDLQKQLGEDEDVDDKDAVAQAKAARGKFKKLDIAVKALKDITTNMKSLARKYSAADESDKEVIKNELKQKTSKKKELESLVAKLEKDAI
jgi:translation initiation factor 2 beta subunit (eIF-2beta)/eIF-5|tara:strand:+ start:861 stop:1262 length:402 start_codon:yes stop_codon:yes gene_type:complete